VNWERKKSMNLQSGLDEKLRGKKDNL